MARCPSCGEEAVYICPETKKCLTRISVHGPARGCLENAIVKAVNRFLDRLCELGPIGSALSDIFDRAWPETGAVIGVVPDVMYEISGSTIKKERRAHRRRR